MSMADITALIGSVGFPIVMVILLWQYIKEEQSKTREILYELKETILTLTQTIKEGGKRADDN